MKRLIMESKKVTSKFSDPPPPTYISSIDGPLLFTAPHSGELKRGGEDYNERRRTHLREQYTSVLVMRFALETPNLLS